LYASRAGPLQITGSKQKRQSVVISGLPASPWRWTRNPDKNVISYQLLDIRNFVCMASALATAADLAKQAELTSAKAAAKSRSSWALRKAALKGMANYSGQYGQNMV